MKKKTEAKLAFYCGIFLLVVFMFKLLIGADFFIYKNDIGAIFYNIMIFVAYAGAPILIIIGYIRFKKYK